MVLPGKRIKPDADIKIKGGDWSLKVICKFEMKDRAIIHLNNEGEGWASWFGCTNNWRSGSRPYEARNSQRWSCVWMLHRAKLVFFCSLSYCGVLVFSDIRSWFFIFNLPYSRLCQTLPPINSNNLHWNSFTLRNPEGAQRVLWAGSLGEISHTVLCSHGIHHWIINHLGLSVSNKRDFSHF